MNVDRAFERRARLEARLAAAAAMDFTGPEQGVHHGECREAVDGMHGAANWRGHCPYCDAYMGGRTRLTTSSRPDVDVEDVIDDITLSPVAACERADVWQEQATRRFRARRSS